MSFDSFQTWFIITALFVVKSGSTLTPLKKITLKIFKKSIGWGVALVL